MYLLYSTVSILFVLAVSPYFLYQAIRYRKYVGSLRQRLGYLPVSFNLDGDASIWIHAVSVGEALTARAIIEQLRDQYPRLRIFVSTTTMTGQQVAKTHLRGVDGVFFFPFDLGFVVRRTLRIVRPTLFISMETEIWPHLLRECRRHGVRTLLVNGRISGRSYPRYRLARPFFRRVLADLDRACMQSEESARRLIDIGIDPRNVTVTGSLKFDSLEVPGHGESAATARGRYRVLRYFRVPDDRPVVIAASTLKGEEEPVLRAFARIRDELPRALLVIAPRKPERFAEAEALALDSGFSVARRSELPVDAEPRTDIVILDTIGELAQLYHIATAVFVGGSLVDAGGHNILEPAAHGKPIVVGPHMSNFAEITRTFLENGAVEQVADEAGLEEALLGLLHDPVRRARLGAAARALVEANRGARSRTMAAIAELLPPGHRGQAVIRPFRRVH
ncbi:MAG TPA: 3-deoxy-D-manno-octulosonic acid transferase [Vicinamibacterales bacterium]|nr:3-deoxy-D-manno-octulosonic acid transferase [Vicinamibacterales bacterium]